jgi:N-acetylneuraminate synthase
MIIAEIGQAHDGSVGILHSYIDALAKTGVDVVKFQTHIAGAESSEFEPFRVKFSYVDSTRYDYWKRMEFTWNQWKEIKSHCDDVGVEFLSSPFSVAAVEMLDKLGVKGFKVGSGEVRNLLMLDRIAQTGKPVILSSGMSSYDELDEAFHFLVDRGVEVSVMQCTTAYPTPANRIGLNVLNELRTRYKCRVGLSDHSGTIFPCVAAAALGAELFEFHAVFDKRMFGPDSSSSLTIDEIAVLTQGIRFIQESMQNPVDKADISGYAELKQMFEKSLALNRDLKEGEVISIADLEAKKPSGRGLPASDFELVIGKRVNRNIKQWSFLNADDIR